MAALTEQLKFLISANADGAIRAFEKTGKSAEKELGKAEDKIEKLGGQLTKFGAGAMVFAGIAGKSLYGLVDGASSLSETVNKVDVIFGDASQTIKDFSVDSAKSLGMSRQSAMDAASTFATFGKSAGLVGEDLSGFAIDLSGLAADLASFHNTSPEDAVVALGAALRGESEPIRRYGVMLNDAALKQAAMTMGIYDGKGALTAQQKVLAAQKAILEQTSDAQGDFARTSDGLANKQRILKAEIENLKNGIGAGLLPMVQTMVGAASDAVGVFGSLDPAVQSTIGEFAGFGVAAVGLVGSMSFIAGSTIKMRDRFTNASGALNGFGKMAAGATIALVGLYAIAKIFEAQSESGTAKTVAFTDALKENDKAARASNLRKLAEDNPLAGEFLETMGEVGITVDDMAQYLRDLDGPADTFRDAVSKVANTSFDSVSRIEALNDALGINIDTTKMTGEQADSTWSRIQNLSFGLFNLEMANLDATTATEATAGALTGIALEGDDAADAIDAVTGAAFELTSQWKETLGLFDRESALRNVKDDLVELKEAATEAFSTGKQEDIDRYREKLGSLYKGVGDYIVQLGDVAEEKQTEILALLDQGKIDEAYAELDKLTMARTVSLKIQPYVAGFTSPSFISDAVRAVIPGRASGGPISANQPYVVGERGPEIIVPGSSGTVIPNNKLGGSNINITINAGLGTDGKNIGELIVREINKFARSGGTKIDSRIL
jgi:hypothetical protein